MRTVVKIAAPRRHLVLTSESARHPFRASLPPHMFEPEGAAPPKADWRISKTDWRQFLGTYAAGFVAVTAFIS